jgi:hypothetical protein
MTGGMMNFCGSRSCIKGRRRIQPPEPGPGTPPEPDPGTPPEPEPGPGTPPEPESAPQEPEPAPPPGSPPGSPSVSPEGKSEAENPSEDEMSRLIGEISGLGQRGSDFYLSTPPKDRLSILKDPLIDSIEGISQTAYNIYLRFNLRNRFNILKLFKIASEGLFSDEKKILMDEIIKLYAYYKTKLSYDDIHKVFLKYYDPLLKSMRDARRKRREADFPRLARARPPRDPMDTIRSRLDKMVPMVEAEKRMAFASALSTRLVKGSPLEQLAIDLYQPIDTEAANIGEQSRRQYVGSVIKK